MSWRSCGKWWPVARGNPHPAGRTADTGTAGNEGKEGHGITQEIRPGFHTERNGVPGGRKQRGDTQRFPDGALTPGKMTGAVLCRLRIRTTVIAVAVGIKKITCCSAGSTKKSSPGSGHLHRKFYSLDFRYRGDPSGIHTGLLRPEMTVTVVPDCRHSASGVSLISFICGPGFHTPQENILIP